MSSLLAAATKQAPSHRQRLFRWAQSPSDLQRALLMREKKKRAPRTALQVAPVLIATLEEGGRGFSSTRGHHSIEEVTKLGYLVMMSFVTQKPQNLHIMTPTTCPVTQMLKVKATEMYWRISNKFVVKHGLLLINSCV